jgi:hypothetical protein
VAWPFEQKEIDFVELRKITHKLARNRLTLPLRMLPDFLLVGAQKSGTSSLFTYIVQHPHVLSPLVKEIHYFDLHYSCGPNWYREHFRIAVRNRIKGLIGDHQPITGEASPYYIYHPLVPARIKELLPHIKLIVLLRNPIDRAYSHYHHVLRKGPTLEPLTFEQAIQSEESRLRGETQRIATDHSYLSLSHQHHSYLNRGIYADQLERWFKQFAIERFLILPAEDLFDQPQSVVYKVFRFLELPNVEVNNLRPSNQGKYMPMAPETRAYLSEYYRPHNIRLSDLLGREFDWD